MSLASRSFRRIRTARILLAVFAAMLIVVVAWTIWSRQPPGPDTTASHPSPSTPSDALHTIEKFRFTSTLAGRKAYSIVADRLLGVVGGVHRLEAVRQIEIVLQDGKTLRGSADHGTYTEMDGATPGTEQKEGPAAGQAKNGSGRGGQVVLWGNVRIESPDAEQFQSDRIEYDQATQTMVSPGHCSFRFEPQAPRGGEPAAPGVPGPVRDRGGPSFPMSGESARLEYKMDARTAVLDGGLLLRLEQPGVAETVVRAEHADISISNGAASFSGALRITRGDDWLSAPNGRIERADGGRSRLEAWPSARARLGRGSVSGTARPAASGPRAPISGPSGEQPRSPATKLSLEQGRPVLAAADRITIEEHEAGDGAARAVTLAGRASVEEEAGVGSALDTAAAPGVPAAEARASAPPAASLAPRIGQRIAAETILMSEEGAGAPRQVRATGNVTLRMPPSPGETAPRTMSCADLDAKLASDGHLLAADAAGGVLIRASDRTATAASARFIGETRIELRGGRPKVEESGRTLVANEIDMQIRSAAAVGPAAPGRMDSRGSVRTHFTRGSGFSSGPFTSGEPVDVSSDQAEFRDDPRTALFTGKVVARQSARAISSAKLFVNDADKTATAEGGVSVRSFRHEPREASPPTRARSTSGPSAGAGRTSSMAAGTGDSSAAPSTLTSGADSAGRTLAPAAPLAPALPAGSATAAKLIPIHVSAESLFYDERTKTTRFEGSAIYREPGRTISADRITTVGGAAGDPSETTAEGHVRFEGEGKKGEGDFADHRAEEKTLTLTGKDRLAQVTEIETGRTWRGPSLTWSLTPDSIPVASGESGRSTIKGPGPAESGNTSERPSDRAVPR